MRKFILFLFLLSSIFLEAQLIPNGGFEIDAVAPFGKPDFFRFRSANFHELETDTVRTGASAARFNNTSGNLQYGYYYSNYDAPGIVKDFVPVMEGETYELNFYYRTAVDFVGDGVSAQIIFANDLGHIVGDVIIDPYRISPNQWSLMRLTGTIPPSTTQICAAIYYYGRGKAWVDDVSLTRIGVPIAPNLGYELDQAAPFDKPDFHRPRFQNYHHLETAIPQTYRGKGAAKFNNTSGTDQICYYYGNYDAAGLTREAFPVYPNDRYRFTGFARTSDVFTGDGVFLSAIFFDENGSFVARHNSPPIKSTVWKKIGFEIQVPENATQMVHSSEYKGQQEAWFDHVRIEKTNPLLNSGFETDKSAPFTKPDHWKARTSYSSSTAGLETDTTKVYAGKQCIRFTSLVDTISYYYGPYDEAGNTRQGITVKPGQEFELKAQTKTSQDFAGTGLKLSIVFWSGNSFHSRVDLDGIQHNTWTAESVSAIVPGGVNNMTASLEFNGSGTGWFDNVEFNNLDRLWYERDAPLDTFETLYYQAGNRVGVTDMIHHFQQHDTLLEANYNLDGTWGVGYNCQPLIRTSANAALGYLNAYSIIPEPRYVVRATEALDHLVQEQHPNGAYSWYFDEVNCGNGSLAVDAVFYEGGIAAVAMIKGFEMTGDSTYLEASNKFCQYVVGQLPSANGNTSGFALWALAENYRITANPVFLETAMLYFESLHAFQQNSGMWMDKHNQRLHYHAIMIRSIVSFMISLPNDHPKREVIRHSAYKGINHCIRSQRPGGKMLYHPKQSTIYGELFSSDPMVMGWDLLGFTDLTDPIDEHTIAAKAADPEVVHGHRFASIGFLLYHYYRPLLEACPLNYAGPNKLQGTVVATERYQTNGKLESNQLIIGTSADVLYSSDTLIELLPGFSVDQDAEFETLLDGCD